MRCKVVNNVNSEQAQLLHGVTYKNGEGRMEVRAHMANY